VGVDGLQYLVIHIFIQERREFYNLEDLWSEVPKTQIDTDSSAQPPTPHPWSPFRRRSGPRDHLIMNQDSPWRLVAIVILATSLLLVPSSPVGLFSMTWPVA